MFFLEYQQAITRTGRFQLGNTMGLFFSKKKVLFSLKERKQTKALRGSHILYFACCASS